MLQQKLKYSPTFSSWNPDKYPYCIVSVKDIFVGNNAETYMSEKRYHNDEIIFINKGTAVINHFYKSRSEIKTLTVSQNDVVLSTGGTYCEISKTSNDSEFTVIRFQLFTCDMLSSRESTLDISDMLSENVTHSRMYISIPLCTHLSENEKTTELISGILKEYKKKVPGYQMQIQTSLLQLLLILRRNNFPEFDKALCHANLIGITSKYSSNTALPPNCRLTVSDVEILPKKPEPSAKISALSVYKTTKSSLLPEYYDTIHCDYEENPEVPNTISISATTESGYHVWLYPSEDAYTPDLREHKENAYIRFFAKSTLAMSFGVVIYNHDNHTYINHTFYMEPSNEFQEFCIPLLPSNEEKKMSAYIYDTLDYIDKNYQSKIKLEDMAETVHLNPSYLSKVFKEQMGISISDHILSRRLNAAVIMLKKYPEKPISDIAVESGFYDTAHFSKAFKNAYSMTAVQYKKRLNLNADRKNKT